ncbi:hypothetical protein D3C81_439960 [compost metagenome]
MSPSRSSLGRWHPGCRRSGLGREAGDVAIGGKTAIAGMHAAELLLASRLKPLLQQSSRSRALSLQIAACRGGIVFPSIQPDIASLTAAGENLTMHHNALLQWKFFTLSTSSSHPTPHLLWRSGRSLVASSRTRQFSRWPKIDQCLQSIGTTGLHEVIHIFPALRSTWSVENALKDA